ncbi:unnamed protein product [Urochloa decumbens]|uniref:Leucine-rich repeat-containing N-terminal plant-type domain-containing protein n=1 Tax=Urochloa decumbens TaxID=240449 RepID=A0ABC9ALJ4_9POAL
MLLLLLLLLGTVTFSSSSTSQCKAWPRHGPNITSSGSCLPHERGALMAFKKGISGDPAGRLASWNEGEEDCCKWRGVSCSNQTSHVLGIRLRNIQAEGLSVGDTALVGQISPSLLSLYHLEHLDLSMNNVSGPANRVPEFLGLFRNLRYLDLSGMPFTGRVPPQLGNLSKLQHLDLSSTTGQIPWRRVPWHDSNLYSTDISWLSNLSLVFLNMESVDLSRIVDWAHVVNMVPSLKVLRLPNCFLTNVNQSLPYLNLTDLEELSLSENHFDHPVASCWFWNLTSLRYLQLAGTHLYGQMPDALGGLTSLQVLDMSFGFGSINMMTANMKNLCNLEIIDFREGVFSGNITELLPQCTPNTLKGLYLANNNFSGVLPNWIGRWTSLLILDLSFNKVSGNVPSEISLVNNLLTLDLSNNLLTGGVPSDIGMLSNLTDMDLSNNNLSGVITHEHLAGLTRLKNIALSGNSLKIVVDPEWSPIFRLEYASFASCHMGPLFPSWLRSQTHIDELIISSASIFDRLPDWFVMTFQKANGLDISNNGISGTLPTDLKNMTSLGWLKLNSNDLSGSIPRLPKSLSYLDISENSLSGPLPPYIGAGHLENLNLASNRISGPIPKSICKINSMGGLNLANNYVDGEFPLCFKPGGFRVLILHNNRLSGKFPSSLKTWTNLYVLDLAWNKLSGKIPSWIGNFTELEILQLSHNMFTESIPSTITRLSILSQLNVAGNSLSGCLPRHLSNLTGMTTDKLFPRISSLDDMLVSVNLSVINKGQELYYRDYELYEMASIDLSSNHLTDRIPEGIASLDGVINLNLSWNQLSGEIPNNIGGMQSLESLDLSENKINGRIPSGGQLDTLYMQYPFMYNGKRGLCGHPLLKNCSSNSGPQNGGHERDEHDSNVLSFSFGLGVGYMVGL